MDIKGAFRDLQQKKQAAEKEAKEARAPLLEIVHSLQGSGRFVGMPMTFVKVVALAAGGGASEETGAAPPREAASVDFGVRSQHEPNPVRATRAAELVRQVAAAVMPGVKTPRINLHGEDPLNFPEFSRELGQAARDLGFRLHLETAAQDPDALAACVNQVDHLTVKYSLGEASARPVAKTPPRGSAGDSAARSLRCCEIALRRGATVDVKIALAPEVSDVRYERALEQLQALSGKVLLVLQPVTPFDVGKRALPVRDLERWVATAARSGFDVRVLPAVHKLLNVR